MIKSVLTDPKFCVLHDPRIAAGSFYTLSLWAQKLGGAWIYAKIQLRSLGLL